MNQKYWHIEGYESTTKIYDRKVKVGFFSENQIRNLLKALAAKAGLTFDEIVGAYAKKKTMIFNDLLSIQKEGPHPVYMCGDNPSFIARVIVEDL
jgi:hypothetical protein